MENIPAQPEAVSQQVRQLAAIMFADMTGYTAMMQEDEERAKTLRSRQKHALDNFIPAYNGRIIQYFGDGTLSMFGSAIDAVNAAIAIQKELRQEPKVQLRIGIHSGEVVLDKELIDEPPSVLRDHRPIPNRCHRQCQWNPPKQTLEQDAARPFAAQDQIQPDDAKGNDNPDKTFGKQREAHEKVEAEKESSPFPSRPDVPGE